MSQDNIISWSLIRLGRADGSRVRQGVELTAMCLRFDGSGKAPAGCPYEP